MGDELAKRRVTVLVGPAFIRELDALAKEIGGDVAITRSALLRTAAEKGVECLRRAHQNEVRP
jgi:hypothetical protein